MKMKKTLIVISLFLVSMFSGCQNAPDKKPEAVKDTTQLSQVMTRERQNNLAISDVEQIFKDGNERFITGKTIQTDFLKQVEQTGKEGQFPKAIVLSCIDSRAPIEAIFDKGIGDIFGTRVAGNYSDEGIIGGIEYACFVAGAKLIIVLGHTDCGAIKSVCDNVKVGNITYIMDELRPAVDSVKGFENDRTSANKQFVDEVTKKNVELTMKKIMEKSKIVQDLVHEGKVKIIGGIYDVKTGKVNFIN